MANVLKVDLSKVKQRLSSEKLTLLMMTLPSFLCLVVFSYGPIYGWMYAFFDYKIGMRLSHTHFAGFKYFKIALSDPDLIRVTINTLAMSFLGLLAIPFAAILAIMLSELRFKRYAKFLQVVTTLPNFMSWIIVFSIFFLFFSPGDGIVNSVLQKAGWISAPLDPLGNESLTWFIQTGIKFWKELGYSAIIFFAAIAGIDSELYDAGKVDGANRFQIIRHITIPGLMPTAAVLLIISVGFMLSNGFDQYYVFFNGLVANKIEVLDYYVYRMGIANDDVPFATALSVAKTIISVILVFSVNSLSKRIRGQSII